ncbi:MAG: tRNA pseudouridine(55) synthase TruB [Bacteroidales bacterium]
MNHPANNEFQEGKILLIDKPLEWTSFDVVGKIRNTITRYTKARKIKVGHAGTLDPLASGLLIVCTGKFTKRINEFQDQDKEYTGSFYIGSTTPSFDNETEIDQTYDTSHLTDEVIREVADSFVGEQQQVPPTFSAIKLKGVRAYHMARKNEEVKLSARNIVIKEMEISAIDLPNVHFRVVCSKGTYIRALARDFGKALGCGAYLNTLIRTKIGDFCLSDALSITQFEEQVRSAYTSVK